MGSEARSFRELLPLGSQLMVPEGRLRAAAGWWLSGSAAQQQAEGGRGQCSNPSAALHTSMLAQQGAGAPGADARQQFTAATRCSTAHL